LARFQIFIDERRIARASVEPPYEMLGRFLEEDVQSHAAVAMELRRLIREVRSGQRSSWEGTGNAHTLVLRPTGARIEPEFAEPAILCELALDDLDVALAQWIAVLLQQPSA
jgi:hypothetical protein